MSSYYKPNRNPNWNYGGKNFRLSRSRVDMFLNCPRCFYLDNKLGVARPPGYPFNLNNAVDELLKKEFDIHRKAKTTHPLMKEYNIEAIPYDHIDLDKWRDSMRYGISTDHKPTGLIVRGGIDDVWVDKEGELIIVDYKATSKSGKIDKMEEDWYVGYKRQMEIYTWLFRQNGFNVSDTGYFVYANARKDKDSFDSLLDFEMTIIPYKGDDSWVEKSIIDIKKTLDDENIPQPNPDCDYCRYRDAVGIVLNNKTDKQKGLF